jgi:hypothetical protein
MSDDRSKTGSVDESNEIANDLCARMELLQSKLNTAKIAYLNRTDLDGKVPEYEDVAAVAKSLISLNYQLQKQLYGEVKLKLSVSKLLRASSR